MVHMPGKAKVLSSKEIQNVLKVLKSPRDKLLFATGLYTGAVDFYIDALPFRASDR